MLLVLAHELGDVVHELALVGAPHRSQRLVAGDPTHPRPRRAGRTAAVALSPRPGHGLLRHVLRVVTVAHDPQGLALTFLTKLGPIPMCRCFHHPSMSIIC